jgi:hypothetical protein
MSHSETGGDVYMFFLYYSNRLPNNRFLWSLYVPNGVSFLVQLDDSMSG